MSQHFPQYPDVPLKQAPLRDVICQVRFSPIFRIANDLPSELQESILEWFPDAGFADEADPHLYQFLSHDAGWSFQVGPESFTLSTLRYTVWGEFSSYLAVTQSAMQKVYKIPAYKRIGLRYVNMFTPANTGYESLTELVEILRPELTLPRQTQVLDDATETAAYLLLDESGGKLAMRTGASSSTDEGGPAMFLDLDFYVEGPLPTDGLIERCAEYHDTIYRAFRWSLSPGKLDLFDPVTRGGS
ncbi:MAG: TIGR04255 family protein [Candidatus Binatia bacterium]